MSRKTIAQLESKIAALESVISEYLGEENFQFHVPKTSRMLLNLGGNRHIQMQNLTRYPYTLTIFLTKTPEMK